MNYDDPLGILYYLKFRNDLIKNDPALIHGFKKYYFELEKIFFEYK